MLYDYSTKVKIDISYLQSIERNDDWNEIVRFLAEKHLYNSRKFTLER